MAYMAKKRTPRKSKKAKASLKRSKEIEATFRALNLTTYSPYMGADQFGNTFKRVSLYETEGYSFFTSNKIGG